MILDRFSIVSAILVSVSLFTSPGFADTAILVALPSELDAVRKEVRLVGQPVELGGRSAFIGYRKGEKVYIVRTGAGIVNAAMATQAVLTRYKVDRVISIGVAGNLNEQWAVGDVLIATEVVSHQEGKETPAGFEAKGQSVVSGQLSADYMKKCEELRSNAVEVARGIAAELVLSPSKEMPLPQEAGRTNHQSRISVHAGRLVSGDAFIASTTKRKWLRETFKADAVDMVSAGMARVCEANGVPYVIIRVLSDCADERASADFAAFVQSYREPITAAIALEMIDSMVSREAAGHSSNPLGTGGLAPLHK